LFALVDGAADPLGIVLAVPRHDGAVELKAVAVRSELQGRGIGRRLLALALDELRQSGVRRVVVGTAASGGRQLAFYQRAGFRPLTIERDFFSEARGYPRGLAEDGIAVRDIVWMDREL
jgi:ribosomal protein S18 acetylase RimI-like enzyme